METLEPLLDEPDEQPVSLLAASGVSGDGWCEPLVRFTLHARRTAGLCQFDVWLKPEPDRDRSRITTRFGDEEPYTFELPHDRICTVQSLCRVSSGETIDGVIECDNEVTDRGADLRRLSFRIHRLRFS